MANKINYKEVPLSVGDTISINYKIKEGNKERQQLFEGILTKIKGHDDANRMITVRKMSHSGIGIQRIIPLNSPFITDIKLVRKSSYRKAKAYFLEPLSGQQIRHKLYKGVK
jgi:large subunit ribosomal protein L19